MIAPDYLQHEALLMNNRYFIAWNNEKKRWELRAWKVRPLFNVTPKIIKRWVGQDKPSYLIKRCFSSDEVGNDIGYKNIEGTSFIQDCKRGLYNMQMAVRILREIDEANLNKEIAESKENDYQHRAAASTIWHHYQEPTVFVHKD